MEESTSPPSPELTSRLRHPAFVLAAVIGISAPTVYFLKGSPPTETLPAPIPVEELASNSNNSDSPITEDSNTNNEKDLIWGTWVMDYHGPRYLEINPDNSARLVSFPDMMAQFVVGAKMLSIRCEWIRSGDRIDFKLVEGTPVNSFTYVTKTFGDVLPYEFVSVNETTLTFKDLSDGKHDVWRRVDSIPSKP